MLFFMCYTPKYRVVLYNSISDDLLIRQGEAIMWLFSLLLREVAVSALNYIHKYTRMLNCQNLHFIHSEDFFVDTLGGQYFFSLIFSPPCAELSSACSFASRRYSKNSAGCGTL